MSRRLVIVFALLVGVGWVAAFGVLAIQKADRGESPAATDLGSLSEGGWSTTRPPTVAVADSGTIYVLWAQPGRREAPLPEGIPKIPDEFSFGPAKDPQWSTAPAVSVCRKGKWSRPGLLVLGLKDCPPVFAWCVGEQLHLLLAGNKEEKCNHLRYDPEPGRWTRVAELPLTPSQYDPIRHLGKEVHIACVEGRHTYYFRFDGTSWSKPLRIDASENVTRARLAVGRDGTAHIGWWSPDRKQGEHGYALVRKGTVEAEPLRFEKSPVSHDAFDLAIDPNGRLVLAYQADLPDGHADARKVHLRRREGKGWTEPETIGGQGEKLFGSIKAVWTDRRMAVSWLSREETKVGGGVLTHSVRRLSVTDGKSWSPPRFLALASHNLASFGRVPAGPISLSLCVDARGDVHAVWGSPGAFHCIVAQLGSASEKRTK